MDKRFVGILGGIIVIFIIIFAVTQNSSDKNSSSGSKNSNGQPTSHIEGNGEKNVTLVEWGDYECPICEAYYQPLKQAVAAEFNDIHFQFRNLPLTSIHPNAFAGARAAEAASLQGKFWQMHDKLYENQNDWVGSSNPQTNFDSYARQIGLNISQFDSDYASTKVNNSINADLNTFAKTGLEQATPTFFLNGKNISNSQLVDQSGQPTAASIEAFLKNEIAKQS